MTFESPCTPDEEMHLHRRLVENDATAPSALAVAFVDALLKVLHRTNPKIDEAICVNAVGDAVLNLIKKPTSFRGESLWEYLCMSAQGDLINGLAKAKRWRAKNSSLDSVELEATAGKYPSREHEPASIVIATQDAEEIEKRLLPCARRGLSEEECKALELVIEGERRTEAFAAVLGITERSADDRREIVKRTKDKLKARLKRCREEA